jgi:molybdopterin-guanine dinucleotide biosynthesis protein A
LIVCSPNGLFEFSSTIQNPKSKIQNRMVNASSFITAGGRSSRMGRDKAWLELDGRTMIERVIEAVKPVTTTISIIANSADYSRLGFPVFADTNLGVGPLEAIRTALANSPSEWVILVGCDMPFVTTDFFVLLLNITEQAITDSRPAAAVVPLNQKGLPEPLCALYSIAALPAVTGLIASGERKVSLLFERIPTRFVAFDEIKDLSASKHLFENINTPEDYENIQKSLIFRA